MSIQPHHAGVLLRRSPPSKTLMLAMALLAVVGLILLFAARPTFAQSAPDCSSDSASCLKEWANHWVSYSEVAVSGTSTNSAQIPYVYHFPAVGNRFVENTDGSYLEFKGVEFKTFIVRRGGRSEFDYSGEKSGRGSYTALFTNIRARGMVLTYARVRVTEYHPNGDYSLTTTQQILLDPGVQHYLNDYCKQSSPSSGYWEIMYFDDESSDGSIRRIGPDEVNAEQCTYNDSVLPDDQDLYQTRICTVGGTYCTEPRLAGRHIDKYDLRKRDFDRGIDHLNDPPSAESATYFMLYVNNDADGSPAASSFNKAVFDNFLKRRYAESSNAGFLTECVGVRCTRPTLLPFPVVHNFVNTN